MTREYLGMSADDKSRIESAIQDAALPLSILRSRVELANDSTGSPAAFICLDFRDSDVPRDSFPEFAFDVENTLRDAVCDTGIMRFTYVRFCRVPE